MNTDLIVSNGQNRNVSTPLSHVILFKDKTFKYIDGDTARLLIRSIQANLGEYLETKATGEMVSIKTIAKILLRGNFERDYAALLPPLGPRDFTKEYPGTYNSHYTNSGDFKKKILLSMKNIILIMHKNGESIAKRIALYRATGGKDLDYLLPTIGTPLDTPLDKNVK